MSDEAKTVLADGRVDKFLPSSGGFGVALKGMQPEGQNLDSVGFRGVPDIHRYIDHRHERKPVDRRGLTVKV
jgi:hypothetical protein